MRSIRHRTIGEKKRFERSIVDHISVHRSI